MSESIRGARAALYLSVMVLFAGGCRPAATTIDLPDAPASADYVHIQRGGDLVDAEAASTLLESAVGAERLEGATSVLLAEQAITGRPLVADNQLRLLIDGPETYDAMLNAIAEAQHHVHLETFIFADDRIGHRFAHALGEMCSAGKTVRVVFDGVGSVNSSDDFFESMEASGVEVRKYNPPDPSEDLRIWRVNNRNHRKLLIVDNENAFVGGVNFAGVYAMSSTSDPGEDAGMKSGWRDTHLQIRGPVVTYFQQQFLHNWDEAGDPLEDTTEVYRRPPASGSHLVRALVSEGGDRDEFEIYQTYMSAIQHARSRLWLTHAYFSPNDEFVAAIGDAAKRGVDVRVIVPGFIDFDMIFYASRSNYSRLLKAGARVYERNDALMHAKTAVVDGYWSTVGSANLDIRSFIHNDEINAVVVSSDFAEQMEELFVDDLKQATEVRLDEWRSRGLWERTKEFVSRRFNYWL